MKESVVATDVSVAMEQGASIERIGVERLLRAKSAYTTRRIDKLLARQIIRGDVAPVSGDLVLAKVERIGQHKRLELEHGRRAPLFIGDEVVVCYGNRYAPDQFEAEVPRNLDACHLVAAGGVASQCLSRHQNIQAPTLLQPIGLLADEEGRRINLNQWALPTPQSALGLSLRPLVIVVVGTAMNAGKTTSAAHLIRGLNLSGLKVGAAKLTGTGAGGDVWLMKDAGAERVYDFTDAGFVSTYRSFPHELETIANKLVGHLKQDGAEAIVLEIADGLLQTETSSLLRSSRFRSMIDGVLFAAGDAMGAHNGVQWLRNRELPVIGVSGCVSASPLAAREAAKVTNLPVFDLDELGSPDISTQLLESCGKWIARAQQASQ